MKLKREHFSRIKDFNSELMTQVSKELGSKIVFGASGDIFGSLIGKNFVILSDESWQNKRVSIKNWQSKLTEKELENFIAVSKEHFDLIQSYSNDGGYPWKELINQEKTESAFVLRKRLKGNPNLRVRTHLRLYYINGSDRGFTLRDIKSAILNAFSHFEKRKCSYAFNHINSRFDMRGQVINRFYIARQVSSKRIEATQLISNRKLIMEIHR